MRLFLSSYGIGEQADRLHQLAAGNKKMLFIDNAKDYLSPADRAAHVAEKQTDYQALGFEFNELDLRDYFDDQAGLAAELDGVGIVFLSGGNTFILRRALSYSGFDELLTAAVRADQLVYAGSSAGAILATPSLHGTEHGDDPATTPPGYRPEIVWEGLHFIDDYLIPHFESDWDEQMATGSRLMMDYFEKQGWSYQPLRDGQVYLADGGSHEVVS